MQNGGLEQLMNNPMLRQMAEQFGRGGGMPDINALMQNPQMRQCVVADQNGTAVHGQYGRPPVNCGAIGDDVIV